VVRRNAGNDVKRASLLFVTLTRSVRMFVQPWGAPMIQPKLSTRVSRKIPASGKAVQQEEFLICRDDFFI